MDVLNILDDIKKKYSGQNVHPQCSTYHIKNLELEERKGNRAIRIRYQDIFNWHDPSQEVDRKFVFVEGEAGIGKTVLCTLIAKGWASGDLFQEFIVVLLLPLSQRSVATASSLPNLFSELYNLDERKCHILNRYLKGPDVRKNILIIADGLDQLGQPGIFCDGSFLHNLLLGNLLPNLSVTVMITSRPHSTRLNSVNRFILMRGYNMETIQLCVHSELNNPADKALASYLIEQVENNPLFESVCSVPFNLAMILKLCRSMACDRPLPLTLTDLYAKICWANVESNIKCVEQYKGLKSVSGYHDLPEDLQQSWWLLCELAFRNIEGGSNTSQVDTTMLIMSIEIISFGFLKPVSEKLNDAVAGFKFLHPAFEQYLAVLHFVKQSLDTQLGFIKAHSSDRTLVNYFWRFFFCVYANEILTVKPDSNVVFIQAIQMLSNLLHSSNNEYLLCHYSFESKCKLVNYEVINSLNSTNDESLPMTLRFNNACNVHGCVAMIYVMENIEQQCCVEINFQQCNLNCWHIDKLASTLCFIYRSCNIQVKGLDLSGNILDDSTVADFFYKAADTLQSLEKLSLRSCGVGTKAISAIMNVLSSSSSQSLSLLDLSYNSLSESCLLAIQRNIGTLSEIERLVLKGSLMVGDNLGSLASLMDTVSSQCQALQLVDLSDNYLGESDSPLLRKIVLQLINNKSNLDLRLNDEYMPTVNENIIRAMEESIMSKGTIDQIIAHGIIVGPGRSGKDTLLKRLMGKGPPDAHFISSSTGVLEKVVKLEVKSSCTVAAMANDLKWQSLKYDEEALELMMITAKCRLISDPPPNLVQNQESQLFKVEETTEHSELVSDLSTDAINPELADQEPSQETQIMDDTGREESTNKTVFVRSPDVAPVELLKRALKLRGRDGLRDHFESSWLLYLTNTGGQPEFQEHLPFLISGPTIFFITFPLHLDLDKPYIVEYQHPDGKKESYPSTTTLLNELRQTLATINTLSSGDNDGDTELNIRPKVYFIGTHKDLLKQDAEVIIDKKDSLLQKYVKETSLYRQGSIQFAHSSKRMMFTVNNLSESDDDFKTIRSAIEQTVTRRCVKDFTIKCPTSWLVFSLILREKYHNILQFSDCFKVAQECGISSSIEMKQALSFIHHKLGLVRYYDVEELNAFVVVDPQIIFDKISQLLTSTFTNEYVEENEIEEFKYKGIFSEKLMKKISNICSSAHDVLPSFTWLTKLLNYLRVAALFKDRDGTRKYFYPSALSYVPESNSEESHVKPPILIAFEDGFCPRGFSGALIKCLLTNEMKSEQKWELIPRTVSRNRVSFHIEACGTITLKLLPTHIEIYLESEENTDIADSKTTCKEACTQIGNCVKILTSQCIKCNCFWGFYCTLAECATDPHPAKIEWSGGIPKQLWCKVSSRRGPLPTDYELWNVQQKPGQALMLVGKLDKEIDGNGVPKHIGQIAANMKEWEGQIADHLELKPADVQNIKAKFPSDLDMQKRAALEKWKERLGKSATYNKLISVFEAAGYKNYADYIRKEFGDKIDTDDSSSEPQPPTYPNQSDRLTSKSLLPEPSSEPLRFIVSDGASKLSEGVIQDSHTSVTYLPQLATNAPMSEHTLTTGEDRTDVPGIPTDPKFHCPCGKCTLDAYLQHGCPEGHFPYLELSKLDQHEREGLIQLLSTETKDITYCFAKLIDSTCSSLNERGVTTQEFAHRVLELGVYSSEGVVQKPLMSEVRTELMKSKTIEESFLVLQPHVSFFNFELLKYIIDGKSTGLDEDRKELADYEEKFKQYCTRRIVEVPQGAIGLSSTNLSKRRAFLMLVLKDNPLSELSLEDIKTVEREIATLLGVKSSTLYLHKIDEGS